MEDRCTYCGALTVNCDGTCLAHTVIREFEDNERAVREAEIERRAIQERDDIHMARLNVSRKLDIDDYGKIVSRGYDQTRRAAYFTIDGLLFQVIRPEGSLLVRTGSDPYKWGVIHNRLDLGRIMLESARLKRMGNSNEAPTVEE